MTTGPGTSRDVYFMSALSNSKAHWDGSLVHTTSITRIAIVCCCCGAVARTTDTERASDEPTTEMATLMMTPSRFSNSLASSRDQAPYGANALSMADTLPTVDFGFGELRERMSQFTMRFDEFIERGRKRVLDERNAFRRNMSELEGMYLDTAAPEANSRC